MKRSSLLLLTGLLLALLAASAIAQDTATVGGTIVAPPSTRGLAPGMVRTPLYIFVPAIHEDASNPPSSAETPSSVACIYGVTAPTNGCPRNGTVIATGGAKAIAVVEFGVNSTIQSDMNAFTTQYGLPAVTITQLCSCGSCPINDGTGWDVETALDVEYSHAMAPHAQIIISSFCSDPFQEMPGAETLAGEAVSNAGGGEVSNSFGYGGEFDGETGFDQYMLQPNVVYFTSAGDDGLGPDYPSVSPNTVSAGGTHINRDSNGNFTGTESCWNGSGGGISTMETAPPYQFIISNLTGPFRGTPDMAAVADPATGVAVYSTTGCRGWCQVGGTSVSSPTLAGITNAAGSFMGSTHDELTKTYNEYNRPVLRNTLFFDVVTGNNGAPAKFGWDQCTGIGAPRKQAGL